MGAVYVPDQRGRDLRAVLGFSGNLARAGNAPNRVDGLCKQLIALQRKFAARVITLLRAVGPSSTNVLAV